jgi:hypothetical protein
MNLVRLLSCAFALSFTFVLTATTLYAVPLSTLFTGQTITANDELFSAFTFTASQTTNGGAADPTLIDVTPLTNDPLNSGIKFTAPIGALGTPFGHTGPSSATLSFSYNASTLSGLKLIKDNSLLVNGFTIDAGPSVSILVTEQVFDGQNVLLGTRQALVINGTQVGDASLFDSGTFAPQSLVHVTKSITISGPGTNDGAFLTMFEQRFSEVPEPGAGAVIALGIAAFSALRGGRKK